MLCSAPFVFIGPKSKLSSKLSSKLRWYVPVYSGMIDLDLSLVSKLSF